MNTQNFFPKDRSLLICLEKKKKKDREVISSSQCFREDGGKAELNLPARAAAR